MKIKDKILIIFFIIFLYLPIIGIIFDTNNGLYLAQKKDLKEYPEFKNDIGKFLDEFIEYYEDNFGFRFTLMKFAANLKMKLFKIYPRNVDIKVLKGKDGWLFYKLENELEDFQGRVPLSDMVLNKLIINYKEHLDYFNDSKIKFYILIPPDKSVIYSEYLPDGAIYGIKSDKTRISQLLNLSSDFIYPKEYLLAHKKDNELLYFKTDTHWTYYGAYYGYRALMERIQKDFDINILELSSFEKQKAIRNMPDLANMVNIGGDDKEEIPSYICSKENAQKSDLKVMIYGDSFLEFLMSYMGCTFNNISFNDRRNFNKENIIKSKPDIVILEIVQRNLKHMFD